MKKTAVLLLAHGSPDSVDDVPQFLQHVTAGRALPSEVVDEVKHRYQLIGPSPLAELTQHQAELLARELRVPVYVGMRNWNPFIAETLRQMARDAVEHAVIICLAPQNSRTSVGLYRSALGDADALPFSMDFVESWHDHPLLIKAFAEKLARGLGNARPENASPENARPENASSLPVIFTAHSVPQRTIAGGDPYEIQARQTAALVAAAASIENGNWRFAFQSQGMARGPWLGPTVEETIIALKGEGHRAVFIQPIGFLCDHVEVLYDIDIAFRQFAEDEGLRLWRAESLNGSPALIAALADIVRSNRGSNRPFAPPGPRPRLARNTKLMNRIAIIGGGISGLAAAFALEQKRRAGVPVQYVLFESADRLGGVVRSERVDSCLVEGGPDSFLTGKPWASELCRQLGIGSQLIGSNDAERKTYILVKGKLVQVPDGLVFMVPTRLLPTFFSPLFSFSTKLKMTREMFHPALQAETDESVAAFVARHYGEEVVDRLVDPLLSGIYGGEASHLSLRAVLPRFAAMEEKFGSLTRAMLRNRRQSTARSEAATPLPPTQGSLFTSLKEGMQQLVDTISAQLPASFVRLKTPVQVLQFETTRWSVLSRGKQVFDAVILALPAYAAAGLLGEICPALASELRGIAYSSSITISLGYDHAVRSQLPPGFGFLIPRGEGKRILAVTFMHNKFPGRAPIDRALLRCFLGGTRDEPALDLDDVTVSGIVAGELREILGIQSEPLFCRIFRWKQSMAQYNVGHLERLTRIDAMRLQLPHLFLAGNAYSGIGIPDCVRSGTEAANSALALLKLDG